MVTRTRFAPSPTGYLHIGSARTALFCWLYAKNTNGQYVLRIEDTDRVRSTKEAVQVIIDAFKWLGLDADEGPYYQTERFDRYQEVTQQLLAEKKAYKCYCSVDRLDKLREQQRAQGIKPKYDRHCLDKPEQAGSYVIRFKNPLSGTVQFNDLIRGKIEIDNAELDDLIISRSDGTPTYNFTVVVDDSDMDISLVIRGEDHIANTPRQINIFEALGRKTPTYSHVPLIMGSDGKRLSKRHGAVSVLQFRDDGYLPQALLNYLVRLGWSHKDQEIFSIEEMQQLFSVDKIHKSAATFDMVKLDWLNQHYIKTLPEQEVAKHLSWHMQHLGLNTSDGPKLTEIVLALRERAKTLVEMAEKSRCFYEDFTQYPQDLVAKHFKPEFGRVLVKLIQRFEQQQEWQKESLHDIIATTAKEFELKLGKVAQPLRLAVTGSTISPSIDVTLQLIGKDKVLSRLKMAQNVLNS